MTSISAASIKPRSAEAMMFSSNADFAKLCNTSRTARSRVPSRTAATSSPTRTPISLGEAIAGADCGSAGLRSAVCGLLSAAGLRRARGARRERARGGARQSLLPSTASSRSLQCLSLGGGVCVGGAVCTSTGLERGRLGSSREGRGIAERPASGGGGGKEGCLLIAACLSLLVGLRLCSWLRFSLALSLSASDLYLELRRSHENDWACLDIFRYDFGYFSFRLGFLL